MSITAREPSAATPDADADSTGEPIRGRFKLTPVGGNGAVIGWATDLCDYCSNCTCGTQRQPLDLTPQGAMRTFKLLQSWRKNGVPG